MDTPSQEGARKRRRSDIAAEDTVDTVATGSDDEPIVRDKTYYRENGDCVILVGKVLFKIHRFLLERDASAFTNMFSMPQENEVAGTTTDENPLVLYDDVDDFRALCWIIYALPSVYMKQFCSTTPDIQKIVSLYLIAHKYHFESHESFARHLIHQHCTGMHSRMPHAYFMKCAESRLQSVLRISILTEKALKDLTLPALLQQLWILRLKRPPQQSISHALDAGEALGLRNFVAELYYLQLTRMKPALVQNSNAYTLPPNSDLKPHQQLALYQGNWSLRYYWAKTKQEALKRKLDLEPQFAKTHICAYIWVRCWERCAVRDAAFRTFNPQEELNAVKKDIIAHADLNTQHVVQCAVSAMDQLVADLEANLAVHFLGPAPAPAAAPAT